MTTGEEEAEQSRSEPGDTEQHGGRRALPDGAERHPLIDLSRDPNPGRPDHAKPED